MLDRLYQACLAPWCKAKDLPKPLTYETFLPESMRSKPKAKRKRLSIKQQLDLIRVKN